jgi:hypothetical protein
MEKCAIAQNLYCTEILTVPKKEIHGMSAPQLAGTPVLILKEGSSRSRGRDALHANIMAAQIVAEAVRSALGPKGLDKMLVDELGDACMHAGAPTEIPGTSPYM